MSIKLNNITPEASVSSPISVNEATNGLTIGTLSGGSNYYITDVTLAKFLQINGSTLSLKANSFFDYEKNSVVINGAPYSNGVITSQAGTTWIDNFSNKIEINDDSGSAKQFSISIKDKNEAITITPTKFEQNKYGATIAQIIPTDSYFSGKDTYLYDLEGSFRYFLEISGTNLKFKDDTYYSETGKILNSSYQLDLSASNYATKDDNANSRPDNDLYFTLINARTAGNVGEPGLSNIVDLGYTKLSAADSIKSTSIFGSDNINKTAALTLKEKPFFERDYGATIAEINYSGTEKNISYTLLTNDFFELTASNKIKLKDNYYYDKSDEMIKKEGGNYKLSENSTYKIQITAENTDNNKKLYTEIIQLSEFSNSVFGSANVNATAKISITPVKFNDKKMGAIVGQINYSGSEPSPTYTLSDHWLLELSGSDKIKLKDDYFYDMNRNAAVKDEIPYELSDPKNSTKKFNITAKNANGTKNLNIETFTLGDISSSVFNDSNLNNLDESYTYVTDIKYKAPSLDETGRKEYQKNIIDHWVLSEGEKISYSFLQPGAAYVGNYNEMKGLIKPSTDFENAAIKAFNTISSFADITFEKVPETGNVVGDFRIGIVDKDHFGMASQYAAYSQGVGNSAKSGNIFFNGGKDDDSDNIPDYNEPETYAGMSGAFTTFLHEILHSLGQKHPFDVIDSNSTTEGTANIYQDKYEQYPYTIMSYTPLRDKTDISTKYDGIALKGAGQYYPNTPMLFDVMALQEIYGANKSTASGDDTYKFTNSAPPFHTLHDTGGDDVIDLSEITGGSEIDLSGEFVSTIGSDLFKPFKTEVGKPTTFGDSQGAVLGIVPGTKIEKVILPSGSSSITTGNSSTYIVGKENEAITANIKSSTVGIKSSGSADDIINLKQTTEKWSGDFQARHMGNNGKGATQDILNMRNYLKHDLSLNLAGGTDTINGTSGNDALFLQNFGTNGDPSFYNDTGKQDGSARFLGVEKIKLLEGDNFLDLTGTNISLAGNSIIVTSGTGNDILWLSDANETVSSGHGNDLIFVNGGTDLIETSNGEDVITICKNSGNLTISDFDTSKDKFIFKVPSNKVTVLNNKITVENESSIGDYTIILSNVTNITNLSDYSTFS